MLPLQKLLSPENKRKTGRGVGCTVAPAPKVIILLLVGAGQQVPEECPGPDFPYQGSPQWPFRGESLSVPSHP